MNNFLKRLDEECGPLAASEAVNELSMNPGSHPFVIAAIANRKAHALMQPPSLIIDWVNDPWTMNSGK